MAWDGAIIIQAFLTYVIIGYFIVLLVNQVLGIRLLPHHNSTLFLASISLVIFLEWILVRFAPEMNANVHRFVNQYTPSLFTLIPLSIILLLWSHYFGLYTPTFTLIFLGVIVFLTLSMIKDYFDRQSSNSLTA